MTDGGWFRPQLGKAPLRGLLLCCGLWLAATLPAAAAKPEVAAIASAHPLATAAGFEVLDAGGNAFDAAVAVAAALAVVEPHGSGLGGGGFWLLHRAADSHDVMVDGRERAPGAAHRDLYLDADGAVVPGLSVDGPLAAGIPGTPAALAHLAGRYGRLPLRVSLAPAARLARDGFDVDEVYRRLAGFRRDALRASADAARIFLHQGEVPPLGHRLRQPELADLIDRLGSEGAAGFYRGEIAQRLVAGVRAAGGIWQPDDLADYRIVERAPVVGTFAGHRVVSASPPSSGGIAIMQVLGMLERLSWPTADPVRRAHLTIEAMRRAYRDRALHLGDPDHVRVPRERLLSDAYLTDLARSIDTERATPSAELPPAVASAGVGRHTTHYSILDADGNRVAATLSINYPFGSGFVVPGTGLLLNDEMDDFSAKPGVPNVYGLIGGEANAIAPGKRMLSSMSPTFVEGPQRIAILGTPGGSRIITMVLRGVLDVTDGVEAEALVTRPRLHHQYLPDQVQIEPGALTPAQRIALERMGHGFEEVAGGFGNMQAVVWDLETGRVQAASDPRGIGSAEVRAPGRPND